MIVMQKLTPCLWFDHEGLEAAEFYTSVFPDSRIVDVFESDNAGSPDSPLVVEFELNGQSYQALNGGPQYAGFTPAISISVDCESQDEVDDYWARLTDGGEEGPCGWLTDRYGLSWQIVPRRLVELLRHPDPDTARRVMDAMMQMKKIEIDQLEQAAAAPV
jgi:predicted 3-demethylubiquinone-9 3-methyltransferase (glyoxalase superfamily)